MPIWQPVYLTVAVLGFIFLIKTHSSSALMPMIGMAIAHDADSVSADGSASPLAWNHTCAASAFLAVGSGINDFSATTPTTSGVTFNASAMTSARADAQTGSFGSHVNTSVWLHGSPASGAHSISASYSGTSFHVGGQAVSYTGCQSSSTKDASGGTNGTTTGAKTFTVTTVVDNCWIYCFGMNANTSTPTLAATQTSRGTLNVASAIAAIIRGEDTNAAQTPAGAKTVGFTVGGAGSEDAYTMSGASFGPTVTPPLVISITSDYPGVWIHN